MLSSRESRTALVDRSVLKACLLASLRRSTNATRGYQMGSWNAGAAKHSECERGTENSAFQGGEGGGAGPIGGDLVPSRIG
jgi:hypothetical protein